MFTVSAQRKFVGKFRTWNYKHVMEQPICVQTGGQEQIGEQHDIGHYGLHFYGYRWMKLA
jgi:hypothetical protein